MRLIALTLLLQCFASLTSADDPVQQSTGSIDKALHELSNQDQRVRHAAAQLLSERSQSCLIATDPEGIANLNRLRTAVHPHLQFVSELLDHPDEEVRSTAYDLVAAMGPDAAAFLPRLQRAYLKQATVSTDQGGLGAAIFYVTPYDESAFRVLVKGAAIANLAATWEPAQWTSVEGFLTGMSGYFIEECVRTNRVDAEMPALIDAALYEKAWAVRIFAIKSLGEIGPLAWPAVPSLRKLLKDDDRGIRLAAAYALVVIESDPNKLEEMVGSIKVDAAEAKELSELAASYFDSLKYGHLTVEEKSELASQQIKRLKQLAATRGYRRRHDVYVLGRFGPSAREAVPLLLSVYRGADELTRQEIRRALGNIAPDVTVEDPPTPCVCTEMPRQKGLFRRLRRGRSSERQ